MEEKLIDLLDTYENTVKEILHHLDKRISDLKKSENQLIFNLRLGLDNIKELVNNISQNPGIYLFEVDFRQIYNNISSLDEFKGKSKKDARDFFRNHLNNIWCNNEFRNHLKFPKINRSQFEKHYKLRPATNSFKEKEWTPFYLGSSKNINKRVIEHLESNVEGFWTMHLSQLIEHSQFNQLEIRLSYSDLQELNTDIKYNLIEIIESDIRECIHPIVGNK